jgi:hypothetical protein
MRNLERKLNPRTHLKDIVPTLSILLMTAKLKEKLATMKNKQF